LEFMAATRLRATGSRATMRSVDILSLHNPPEYVAAKDAESPAEPKGRARGRKKRR